MAALGLKQQIKEPTHISFRNGVSTKTRIDLIFTNSDLISQALVLDLNLSDHLAIMVTRKKMYTKPGKFEFKGRSYRNYDKELFQDRLTGLDWEGFFEVRDPTSYGEQ